MCNTARSFAHESNDCIIRRWALLILGFIDLLSCTPPPVTLLSTIFGRGAGSWHSLKRSTCKNARRPATVLVHYNEILCQSFCTCETVTFWRARECSNDQNREDSVYTWSKLKMTHLTPKIDLILLKRRPIPPSTHGASFTIWHLCHWLSTGDATVWLPPCALWNSQAHDGEWWGVIGSVFVLSISEFKWILRFKIQVRSFYYLQPPQDDDFELFVFVPKMFLVFLLFCTKRNKMQYDN